MARLLRATLKWTMLTVVAVVLGTALGTAYATNVAPIPAEALAPGLLAPEEAPEEEPVGLKDRTAPPAPVLVAPAHGAIVGLQPRFDWDPVLDASNVIYAIQVSTDPGFPKETTSTYRNLQETEWRAERPLPPLVVHHWRVRALDAGLNEGPWSEARSFTPLLPLVEAAAGRDVALAPEGI